ncbi:hypothetical protein AB0A71_38495 [Kitasatospora aureofaciens]|uniref:restriction endonuclease-related protein n=1 Tax=Kitasatospora aureofaciens TaxID=1894 RepID=UPI0033CAF2A2
MRQADDYVLLGLLAAGLVETGRRLQRLADVVPSEPRARGAFSPQWREGVTQLWWRFQDVGRPAPRNDYAVLDLCRLPFGEWPVELGVAASDRESALIDGGAVSEFALEAARVRHGDVEGQLVEQRLFQELMLVARSNTRPGRTAQDGYVRLRRLLIEHPVLSDLEVAALEQEFPERPADGEPYVMAFVRAAYERRPAEDGIDLVACGECRIPLPYAYGQPVCGTPGCATQPETLHLETLGFYWVLHRAVRRFIHGAGVFELRVFKELKRLGLDPDLWAAMDALDVSFAVDREGRRYWGTNEKDWESPGLLARSFSWPRAPACDRRFLVIPTHRARPTYLRDLEAELVGRLPADLKVEVVSEKRLLTLVAKEHRAQGRRR